MAFKDKLSKLFGFSKKDDAEEIKNEIIEEETQVTEPQTQSVDDAAVTELEAVQRIAEEKAKAEAEETQRL
ncbi:MAG: hypothetical protein J6B23_07230, partial [Clostridia bacterium]|nr:hypothetical protein [Clostridia bacterium]